MSSTTTPNPPAEAASEPTVATTTSTTADGGDNTTPDAYTITIRDEQQSPPAPPPAGCPSVRQKKWIRGLTLASIWTCGAAVLLFIATGIIMTGPTSWHVGSHSWSFEHAVGLGLVWTVILGIFSIYNHYTLHHRHRSLHPHAPYTTLATTIRLLTDAATALALTPIAIDGFPGIEATCCHYWDYDCESTPSCVRLNLAMQILGTLALSCCVLLGVVHFGLGVIRLNLLGRAGVASGGGELSVKLSVGYRNQAVEERPGERRAGRADRCERCRDCSCSRRQSARNLMDEP